MKELSLEIFAEQLASNAPVPGGGGASALVGAIGMALGNMVGSLTVGKKKYFLFLCFKLSIFFCSLSL